MVLERKQNSCKILPTPLFTRHPALILAGKKQVVISPAAVKKLAHSSGDAKVRSPRAQHRNTDPGAQQSLGSLGYNFVG